MQHEQRSDNGDDGNDGRFAPGRRLMIRWSVRSVPIASATSIRMWMVASFRVVLCTFARFASTGSTRSVCKVNLAHSAVIAPHVPSLCLFGCLTHSMHTPFAPIFRVASIFLMNDAQRLKATRDWGLRSTAP